MGLKGPRNSMGASGFISQVSMWEAPPHRKNRIHDLAGFPRGSKEPTGAAIVDGRNCKPEIPAVEAIRKSLLFILVTIVGKIGLVNAGRSTFKDGERVTFAD